MTGVFTFEHTMEWKHIILVGDGMGDYPLAELDGKTPLEAARTPCMDQLAGCGRLGMVKTIPADMEPGSDVANMSLLGYDPVQYHTGRAPLEAASLGVSLKPQDVAFRCNLVTLENDAAGVVRMKDYSAGHISTLEARELVASLQELVRQTSLSLYPGVSYRHLLVWSGGRTNLLTTPPHDISGEPVAAYQEVYHKEPLILSFMERAVVLLADHPVNRARMAAGKSPANAVWLWGQGKSPRMPTLKERFGLSGAMISAVDLLKGLGIYAGLDKIDIPGATGYLDTNYDGKVDAAMQALEAGNFVYVHIEAPDEAGHEGSLQKKLEAIEAFDARVVCPVVKRAARFPKVKLLVITDHLTPISRRTHVTDPVPFLLVKDLQAALKSTPAPGTVFCERTARASGWQPADGAELFRLFVGV
jgi:2,3-bisphosphoglycerate-independent phosphoglycerate mutase